ncbi:PucR family transcriptional regulator [Nocardioides litoris]|uniref:PucR family transcriptional regulator n=1 Tax=Nocardioides litoris TaxID=1926648 RepID=UPI0011240F16|nr:helix-turn-helix domain-containing protein [Nocardioides litoris]
MPDRRLPARPRRTAEHGLVLPAPVAAAIRESLPEVADAVVGAIVEEVPGYTDAFQGPMGETIRQAVQLALGGFLSLASGRRGADVRTPAAPAVEGAYQLGRGEARGGRSTEAILSAYRIGARVSWQRMAQGAVRAGLDAETLASFAALVFAYIDELSAASVAGHTDELATTGRVRQRRLERLAQHLLSGAPEETVRAAAERADWALPRSLTAAVVPESQVRPVLAALAPATLVAADPPGLDDGVLLLVPDAHGRGRRRLVDAVGERGGTVGPDRPWTAVAASYERVLRVRGLGRGPDTEEHLPALVLTADPEALADLRARALAPLADLRPATADKLAETLRLWLLLQGRREEVAEALFVHPQTVRYRMGQLREAYGDALDDPDAVLALVLALAGGEAGGAPAVRSAG